MKLSRDGVAVPAARRHARPHDHPGRARRGDLAWDELAGARRRRLAFGGLPRRAHRALRRSGAPAALAGHDGERRDQAHAGHGARDGARGRRPSGDTVGRRAQCRRSLSSFSFEALMAARESAPHLPRGLIVSAPADADFERMAQLGAVSLHCSRKQRHAATHRARPRGRLPRPRLDRERPSGGRGAPRVGRGRNHHRQPSPVREPLPGASVAGSLVPSIPCGAIA